MTRITLFGGGGFIGSHVTKRLLEHDIELDLVDIDFERLDDVLPHQDINAHYLDIRKEQNDKVCRQLVGKSDIVVDLIAYANPQQYIDKPLDVVELNYDQNLKIVEDCVELDSRLIQFSTCEVYGKTGNRSGDALVFEENESDLIMGPVESHRWIYATAKQLLERMVHAHGLDNNLDWTIIRPFNFIGPQMDYLIQTPDEGTPRVFPNFMSSLLYKHPINLVDGGSNRRSFTHIDDAVAAIELIIENPNDRFSEEIVNIGSPENETTIAGFAEIMTDIYQQKRPTEELPEIREVSSQEFYGEGYEDSERRIPNVAKLKDAGWEPQYDLYETVENAMEYYLKNHPPKSTT